MATRAKEKYGQLLQDLRAGANIEVIVVTPHKARPAILNTERYANFRWLPLSDFFSFQPQVHKELWEVVRKLRAAVA
jgi:hypothetical protein